ncbi:MAG: 4Fe-4S binding protein [Phycisphaerae bacterium]|nr:4Fe-4S binding protein [Phycisphaerae bacterium]
MTRLIISFLIVAILVVSGSLISSRLWSGKAEYIPEDTEIILQDDMTVAEFGKANNLDRKVLKSIFGLQSPSDLQNKVADFGISAEQLNKKVNQSVAIQTEHATKNWFKIPLKGGLWIAFLSIVFVLLRKGKITARSRKIIYITAIVLFGVFLGSDPSPMGTVKDAVVLFGSKGVIFPPRLIAFGVFMLMVIVANKFICSWGCQLGTLQDLIFRLNRNSKDTKGLIGQIKVPFVISNSIRILFFIALTAVAFLWATDIVEHIDPFKIFKPKVIGFIGGAFIALILIAGLFIYRPWCHFFCPFGLVSWIAEKVSIFKIQVDYDKCISCQACSKACPTNVMNTILKQNGITPDCFSCGTCIETCPEKAISFKTGKRQPPPEGKFE